MSTTARRLVSKKKLRFQEDGFDLDLTYVTPRIIAMGYPSRGVAGQYRNHYNDVKRFFDTRHSYHYKVYNLCSARPYDPKFQWFEQCAWYPFEDHNPCAFQTSLLVCEDIFNFLSQDEENVVAIHCKAGKGRTGLIICCYLLFTELFTNVE